MFDAKKTTLPWFAPGRFPLYLAPMAGFTDKAFRTLAKEQGADVLVSEFVHARALLHGGDFTWNMIAFDASQRPFGVQLFGDDPDAMAEAAKRVADRLKPDFIDLNFGCPSPRVTGSCAGSALLCDLPRLGAIAQAVVKAVQGMLPVTAKTRLGWDSSHIVVGEVLERVQDAGVAALAVHGRTRAQRYQGGANWPLIGEVAEKARIPVVANGSITCAGDIVRLRKKHPAVAGAMIGRAAIGYPWIFSEIKAALAGEPVEKPSIEERWRTLLRYAELACADIPGDRPLRPLHSALVKLTHGMPDVRALRVEFARIGTLAELQSLAQSHLARHAS